MVGLLEMLKDDKWVVVKGCCLAVRMDYIMVYSRGVKSVELMDVLLVDTLAVQKVLTWVEMMDFD